MIFLNNRSIISITGENSKNFLQSIISNDIRKINEKTAIYSFILNPQGRFLYELFIFEKNNNIFVDCYKKTEDKLIKQLNLYKIRQDITIKKTNFQTFVSFEAKNHQNSLFSYQDPRSEKMGCRFIFSENNAPKNPEDISLYHKNRIIAKIPDENDLTYEKSLILDYGFDNLNAINYKKGCYVGQEPTARMHYRKISRRKIIDITKNDLTEIPYGTKIFNQEKEIGKVLSSIFYDNKLYFLIKVKEPLSNLSDYIFKAP